MKKVSLKWNLPLFNRVEAAIMVTALITWRTFWQTWVPPDFPSVNNPDQQLLADQRVAGGHGCAMASCPAYLVPSASSTHRALSWPGLAKIWAKSELNAHMSELVLLFTCFLGSSKMCFTAVSKAVQFTYLKHCAEIFCISFILAAPPYIPTQHGHYWNTEALPFPKFTFFQTFKGKIQFCSFYWLTACLIFPVQVFIQRHPFVTSPLNHLTALTLVCFCYSTNKHFFTHYKCSAVDVTEIDTPLPWLGGMKKSFKHFKAQYEPQSLQSLMFLHNCVTSKIFLQLFR